MRLAGVVALALAAPACGRPFDWIEITSPAPISEAMRSGSAARLVVAWETEPRSRDSIVLRLVQADETRHEARRENLSSGDTTGSYLWEIAGAVPGTYTLVVELADENDELMASDRATVAVPGITFVDPTLDFTGDVPGRDIWVNASGLTPLDVEFVATSPATERRVLYSTVIASDLATIRRVFGWDETLPAGTYDVTAEVESDVDGQVVRYVDGGLTVTWRP